VKARTRRFSEHEAVPNSTRRVIPLGYALATAALALVSTVVTLVFTIWPELRPDPRERLGAEVSIFAVEPAVEYDAWLRRTSANGRELKQRRREYLRHATLRGERLTKRDKEQLLAVRGNSVYVRSTIEGFKRRNVRLRWSMYDARRRTRQPDFDDVPAADVDLNAPTDRSVTQLWISPTPPDKLVFVRVELLSRDSTLLAVADTPPFRSQRQN
jgi:hypothetical protein